MAIVVNTNVSSLTAQRNLQGSGKLLNRSLQRLSSGLRINSAKDDAAGLAISDRMNSQVRGLNQAVRNANDGISLMQTGEGALQEATNLLQRIRELAVQAANDTNTANDRAQLQKEVTSLTSELDRIASTTQFNGRTLFDGTFGNATFQVGANADQTITTATTNFRTTQYGNQNAAGVSAAATGSTSRTVSGVNVVINGSISSGTYTTIAGDSAKSIAEGINRLGTGVVASASTELEVSFGASGAYTLEVTSNNATAKTISFSLTSATGSDSLTSAAAAFNDASGTTGVVAKVNDAGTAIVITNADGADINVADTAVANGGTVTVGTATLTADSVADTAVANGQVTFDSDKSFSVAEASSTGYGLSVTSALQAVNTMDVSSVDNATTALRIADAAIAAIDSQRASFGALQNRFESTIANLMNVSENIAAAKSRIVDADFAEETANLTKAQILQQAGLAMLSQANQVPQAALSLLQG